MYKYQALINACLLAWLLGSGIAWADGNPQPSGQTTAGEKTNQTTRAVAAEKQLPLNRKAEKNASVAPASHAAFRFLGEKNLGLGCSKGE